MHKKTLERRYHIFKRVPKTNPHKNKQQTKQNNTRHDNATMKRTKRKRTQICSITKTEKSYNLRIDVVIGNMIKL